MKTLAIRLEDELHAQLSVLAQLAGTSITDEIRHGLEAHLEARRTSPELTNRAQAVFEQIERDAKDRQAAIATLFGTTEQPSGDSAKASKRSPRSTGKDSAND